MQVAGPGDLDGYASASKDEACSADRALLLPAPSEAPLCFLACETFSGARPGYVFKLGVCGLGYYRDGDASPAVSEQAPRGPRRTLLLDDLIMPLAAVMGSGLHGSWWSSSSP